MSVKISQIAKELGLSNKELRKKIAELKLPVGERQSVVKDKVAKEIILTIKQQISKPGEEKKETKEIKKETVIELPPIISVRKLSEVLNLPVTQVITELMKNGILATINEEIDFQTAAIISEDLGFKTVEKKIEKEEFTIPLMEELLKEKDESKLKPRPPVVAILGHVDHGKTKLLDTIRKTNVMATEAGGITQKIGAYQAVINNKKITFLDTPGHEAFSTMRAHGVNLTDIVVLVVAADEGVKPQTIEAADHAKLASSPIIVAINKIDKPEADVEKVKRQLADINLLPEEWGGKTPVISISAKEGTNIDKLLEMILLVAEMENLKANYEREAVGAVIESHLDPKEGPMASILIKTGTLNIGDIIVVGQIYGKVRTMKDYFGRRIKEATPGMPVRIAGLSAVPNFGDVLREIPSEKEAKELISKMQKFLSAKKLTTKKIGLGEIAEEIKKGELKELKIILKTVSQGALEALRSSLENLSTPTIKINIIHAAVGDINESDVLMAKVSEALVVGFKVKILPAAYNVAENQGVKVSLYEIIYQLLDDVKDTLAGLIEPEFVEVTVGRLKILAIFKRGKKDRIVGGKVEEGRLQKGLAVRVWRKKELLGTGKITSLQIDKESVDEVKAGYECGVRLDCSVECPEIEEGDILEVYKLKEQIQRKT